MANKDALKYIVGSSAGDLKNVRIAGAQKPLEQLTISELVQLRPGSTSADAYNVNAVSSDVTISSSSLLAEISREAGEHAVRSVVRSNELLAHVLPDEHVKNLTPISTNIAKTTVAVTKAQG